MSGIISDQLAEAINVQIGRELSASLQYLSIASYFGSESWPALSRHFFRQSDEERDHARRFVDYLLAVNASVKLPAVPAPQQTFTSAEEAVSLALDWEKQVTRDIGALVELATQQHDQISVRALDWFINEQLEEMSSMDTLLSMIRHAGPDGLWHVEHYLSGMAGSSGRGEAGPPAQ